MSRLIVGKVSSDKGQKTIVVTVTARQTHPVYKKQYTQNRKFMAHDEQNEARPGDLVAIRESRPISRKKRYILDKILQRAGVGFEESDAEADLEKEQPVEKSKVK